MSNPLGPPSKDSSAAGYLGSPSTNSNSGQSATGASSTRVPLPAVPLPGASTRRTALRGYAPISLLSQSSSSSSSSSSSGHSATGATGTATSGKVQGASSILLGKRTREEDSREEDSRDVSSLGLPASSSEPPVSYVAGLSEEGLTQMFQSLALTSGTIEPPGASSAVSASSTSLTNLSSSSSSSSSSNLNVTTQLHENGGISLIYPASGQGLTVSPVNGGTISIGTFNRGMTRLIESGMKIFIGLNDSVAIRGTANAANSEWLSCNLSTSNCNIQYTHGLRRQGRGTIYAKLFQFEGNFNNDEKSGQGVFRCPQFGYSGEWVNNFPNGPGTLTLGDGKIYSGNFSTSDEIIYCNGEPLINELYYEIIKEANASIVPEEVLLGSTASGLLTEVPSSSSTVSLPSDASPVEEGAEVGRDKEVSLTQLMVPSADGSIVQLEVQKFRWICGKTYSVLLPNGFIYYGGIEEGAISGYGIFANREIAMIGLFEKGKVGSFMRTISLNPAVSFGWESSLMGTRGSYSSLDGSIFGCGEYLNGIKGGMGAHKTFKSYYVGNYENGLRHGQGKIEIENYCYAGEWNKDYPQGNGNLFYQNQPLLAGYFRCNEEGKLCYSSDNKEYRLVEQTQNMRF